MRVWPLMMAEAPFNRSCKASLSGSPTWSSMPGTRSISACFWMMSKPYSVQSMYAVFMGVSDGLHGWIDVFLVGFLFQPQMKPDDALQVIAHLGIGASDVASTQSAQEPYVLGTDAVESGGGGVTTLTGNQHELMVYREYFVVKEG